MLGLFYLEPPVFPLYRSNKEKEFSKHQVIPVRVRNTRPAVVGFNTFYAPVAYQAQPIVKLAILSIVQDILTTYKEDGRRVYESIETRRLKVTPNSFNETYVHMSSNPRQITGGEPMDTSPDAITPMDRITEASEASVISSTEGPIHSDRVTKRVGSPFLGGKGLGSRTQDSGRRQGSPRPRDNTAYIIALAARAARALGHLDEKIATNQVKIGDLDGRVQELVQDMKDTRREVEEGKQLDATKILAFEAVVTAVENATEARQNEVARLAQEVLAANNRQRELNERQARHEQVSSQLNANIMGQGEASANRAAVLEQEVTILKAQHTNDVQTLQNVIQGQADALKAFTKAQENQMAQVMAMIAKLQPTPTTTAPTQPATQLPANPPREPGPDRIQRWAEERRQQESMGQGRRDKGKEPEWTGAGGGQGGGNQGPPQPPPQGNDPDPSDDGSDNGHGRGGRQGPSWRPERGATLVCQKAVKSKAIGLGIGRKGK